MTAPDYSHRPLLVFVDQVNDWAAIARSADYWHVMAEHCRSAENLRDEGKRIILWLELKGHDDAAAQLDEAMAALRRALWNLQEACEGVYPPDESRCVDALEVVVDKASKLAGAAEDLDDEVPEEAWEGFFDE